MMPLEQVRQQLETLGLLDAAAVLENRLDRASHDGISYVEFLQDLLRVETQARRERYLKARLRLAHFPAVKRLEDFDWAFQPSIDARQIQALASLAFVAEATNILFLGPPGVGKSHLAIALGMKAVEAGFGAYFVTADRLLQDLEQAYHEHRLERRMRVYLSPKVLIVDEFGYLPLSRVAATLFFQLVSARYERGSLILTSNKGFADWGDVLGDPVIATAILDRLLHHSHVVNIRGDSYRLKDKKRAGVWGTPPAAPASPGDSLGGSNLVGASGSNFDRR
jgi:DNA replication protein DnaC